MQNEVEWVLGVGMSVVSKIGVGLVGVSLFALPAANAQSVEYGATSVARTQTILNGEAIKSYTPDQKPVFEVEKKAIYDSGNNRFRQVPVEKSPSKSVQIGATVFGEEVEAEASLVKVSLPGAELIVAGAGADADYAVGFKNKNFQVSGSAGAEVVLLKIKVGGDKAIGDKATNLEGTLEGGGLVGADARAKARVFVGLEGLGLEVGGEAFAGAKVDGTIALKAMICKLGVGGGVTGEASAGAGVTAGAGLSVDWDKLEVTVGAKLAATLGLGLGAKGQVTVSLEGLFDPGELARCLGEKAKAIHAAGVDGTAYLIQPAFNAYYQDPAILRNIQRLEASDREFQRKVRAILAAEYAERQRAKTAEREKALALVGPFSLNEFPILYWDGRNIDNEAYYKTAYQAVERRNRVLREAGFNPQTLGITPLHYGIPVKLSDFTRPTTVPGYFPPGFGPTQGIQVKIGKTSLRNLYPH
jgi:hypothetical protein